jgi:hypothetical protein
MLQDALIIYFTLKPALSPDFAEHAEPIVNELFDCFIGGLHDPAKIEEQYHKVYSSALVYGYEEALEGPYKKAGLDIHQIEDWPADKINFVPQELKDTMIPYLEGTFERFRKNLEKRLIRPISELQKNPTRETFLTVGFAVAAVPNGDRHRCRARKLHVMLIRIR